MTFEQAYKSLNQQQRQAVDTTEGPVLVVAGPGTGKTQILALRIANILRTTDAQAENILCLTFTEAGTKAMRDRLFKFIGADAYHVSINTFHSFANEIIQSNPDKFAFSRELTQLDDLTRLKIIRELIDDRLEKDNASSKLIPFFDKYSRQNAIISSIQDLKKEAMTPDLLKAKIQQLKLTHEANKKLKAGKVSKTWERQMEKYVMMEDFANFYETYQERLKEEGFYDYEDMIMFVIEAFQNDPNLLSDYQERYLYIHVDEYQDTNGSQNEILKLLGNFDRSPNIFAVGDDDQAIYRFQGANLQNILFFGNNFANVQTIPITTNYRSTQIILDIADSLIEKNFTRLTNEIKDLNKKLVSQASLKSEILNLKSHGEVWQFHNSDEENIFLAKEIQKLHDEENVDYKEIAVLYRNNVHGDDVAELLGKYGIPTKFSASKSLFQNELVQKLINLLRVVNLKDKQLDFDLFQIMEYEFLNIPTIDLMKVTRYAYDKKLTFSDVVFGIDLQDTVEQLAFDITKTNPNISEKITIFGQKLLNLQKNSANLSLPRFMEIFFEEIGIIDYVTNQESKFNEFENVLAINSFFEYTINQFRVNNKITLHQFLNDIELAQENRVKISLSNNQSNTDSVNLLTAHSSKGLEFEYVFIIQANDKNWGKPGIDRSLISKDIFTLSPIEISEKELSIEDERRLFFVAITRAKKKVYFTVADEYLSYGSVSSSPISRFITEIDDKHLIFKGTKLDDDKTELDLIIDIDDYTTKSKPIKKLDYSSEEREFLLEQLTKFKLSPSSLNEYLRSPEEFKKNNLIKVPKIKNKLMAMGTAIHFAFEKFNIDFNGESMMSLDKFLANYNESLLKQFEGDEEFESTKTEGNKLLTQYYTERLLKSEINKAIETEFNFSFHNVVLPTIDRTDPIPLNGRLDKIEWVNMDERIVRVIDYKTGSPKTENEIKGLTKSSTGDEWRQLVFYKLLGDLDKQFRPGKNFTAPRYIIDEAMIEYIKKNQSGKFIQHSFKINESDVLELKELIYEVMKRIRNLEFPEEPNITL